MTAVQNNATTTIPGGVTGAGFLPGTSGNPGGRPKGLSRRVRDLVGEDGAAVIDFVFSVMSDEHQRTSDRMQAASWLADRGFGKAPLIAVADDDTVVRPDIRWLFSPHVLDQLPLDDLRAMHQALEKIYRIVDSDEDFPARHAEQAAR